MDHVQRGHPARLQVSGPLAPYAEGWRAELAARGFARHSVRAHAQLMAHLSRWMADARIPAGALTDEVISGYLAARRAEGYRARTGSRVLLPLLATCAASALSRRRRAFPARRRKPCWASSPATLPSSAGWPRSRCNVTSGSRACCSMTSGSPPARTCPR